MSPPENATTFAAFARDGADCGYPLSDTDKSGYANTIIGVLDIEEGLCIRETQTPECLDLILTERHGDLLVGQHYDSQLAGSEQPVFRFVDAGYDDPGAVTVSSDSAYIRGPKGPELIYRRSDVRSKPLVSPLSISRINGATYYFDTDLGLERTEQRSVTADQRHFGLYIHAAP